MVNEKEVTNILSIEVTMDAAMFDIFRIFKSNIRVRTVDIALSGDKSVRYEGTKFIGIYTDLSRIFIW